MVAKKTSSKKSPPRKSIPKKPNTTTTFERERSHDFRWLFLILLLPLIIFACIKFNPINADHTASDLINAMDIDNGDEKVNWDSLATTKINLTKTLTITQAGIYYITGSLSDGSIIVNVTKEQAVKLILDDVTIKNPAGPAISCLEGDDLVIELVGNNTLEDGATYSADLDVDIKGAIYSKADLTFEGNGVLNLTARHEDGIVGKDDLKIKSGTYNITAADDAIRGKDSVYILDGNFNLTSQADGIKSTEELAMRKGFVLIKNGNFVIDAGAKGIKAPKHVLIQNGNFTLKTFDDALHSNDCLGITGGDINITAGDDAIHADYELIVDGGRINIERGYEGIEAQVVTINDGDITLYTADDGINAGSGADASALNRPGANNFKDDEDSVININGGVIRINATGDGIDSNGYLYFNGGTTIIDGPTKDTNGALDAGLGIIMNGGEVIAVGASGMAVPLGQNSRIYNVSVFFPESFPADTEIEIRDADGNLVLSHTSAKKFSHLSAGSSKFIPTKEYTIYINDKIYEKFVISSILTTVKNSNQSLPQPAQGSH
ncbi:carbohydrate-binding domain-containing protein [Candidatus Saccharibacteria bacterium]|nr:carbohydrate-binding domain-containing protein [Candidatus Saccharibacteria bacterium]